MKSYMQIPQALETRYFIIPQMPGWILVNIAVPAGSSVLAVGIMGDLSGKALEIIRQHAAFGMDNITMEGAPDPS